MQDDRTAPDAASKVDPFAVLESQVTPLVDSYFPNLKGSAKFFAETFVRFALLQLKIDIEYKTPLTGDIGGNKRDADSHKKLLKALLLLNQLKATLDDLHDDGWTGVTDFSSTKLNFIHTDGTPNYIPTVQHENISAPTADIEMWLSLRDTVILTIPIAEIAVTKSKPPPHRAKREYLYRVILCLARAWIVATRRVPDSSRVNGGFGEFCRRCLEIVIPSPAIRSNEEKLLYNILRTMTTDKVFLKLLNEISATPTNPLDQAIQRILISR